MRSKSTDSEEKAIRMVAKMGWKQVPNRAYMEALKSCASCWVKNVCLPPEKM